MKKAMQRIIKIGSDGMADTRSFVKISTDIQAILRVCLRNLKGCKFGIAVKRVL
jgi:hypothetical protein